jgi:deazaflavin-dependent oxidoreductase (nitroreductase family)
LVLTTTGRRTGLPRKTPLQYEELDGVIYIGSARGEAADWYRNLLANPAVRVQIGPASYSALAEPLARPAEVLDFLRIRLDRHPFMMRLMLLAHGVPPWAAARGLQRLAERLAAVALRDLRPLDGVGVSGAGEASQDG